MKLHAASLLLALGLASPLCAQVAPVPSGTNPIYEASSHQPFSYGLLLQGGNGVTDMRGGFHFLWAGVQAGRVLTNTMGRGIFRGNFEYGMQFFPYFQAFTPQFDRVRCLLVPGSGVQECTQPYTVGGTYTGMSLTPIILRWNFARRGRFVPWVQGAGGLLWTNHKFPAYGNTAPNYTVNGPNGETSVWNFTPQGGVGFHYFTRPKRSVDFSANGMHISSASLGDRNPGVNASVQFTLGYSWWK